MHKALAHFLLLHLAYVASNASEPIHAALFAPARWLNPALGSELPPLPRSRKKLLLIWTHTFKFLMSGDAIRSAPACVYLPLARATRELLHVLSYVAQVDANLMARKVSLPEAQQSRLSQPFLDESQWSALSTAVSRCRAVSRRGLPFLHRPEAPHLIISEADKLQAAVEGMTGKPVGFHPVVSADKDRAARARESFCRESALSRRYEPVLN